MCIRDRVIKSAAVVTVNKPGYFKGIKTYIAESGKSAFFRIKLIPKTISGSLNAATGGNVTPVSYTHLTLPTSDLV